MACVAVGYKPLIDIECVSNLRFMKDFSAAPGIKSVVFRILTFRVVDPVYSFCVASLPSHFYQCFLGPSFLLYARESVLFDHLHLSSFMLRIRDQFNIALSIFFLSRIFSFTSRTSMMSGNAVSRIS